MSKWQNRIVGYGEEAPDQLLANPANWRTHPKHQTDALAGVLREVGLVQNVIVNRTSGYVVDGHARIALALRDGQPSVPVTYVELDAAEEALILATLDPISAMAGADAAKLDELLREVSTGEAAVQEMLAGLAEEHGVLPGVEPGAGGDEFDATPDEGPTRCQPGDLWVIGGVHRLVCGDSTDPATVARLMGGERAALCATDPPYNVSIDYGDEVDDNKSAEEYERFSRGWLGNAQRHSIRQIVTPGGQNLMQWARWFDPFHIAAWTKPFSTTNGKVAHLWSWEPMFFFGDKWPRKRANDIFEYGIQYDPSLQGAHPCPKPLALWVDIFENYTEKGDLCYEPFSGSGTSHIAAHRTGRRCYGVELEPRYCDVILRRAEAEGLTVERADG